MLAVVRSGIECDQKMLNMLRELQRMHDTMETYYWSDQLHEYAKLYELEMPEVQV